MVNVFGESRHPTRELLKMAFSGFSAFGLESGFEGIKLLSGIGSLLTGMDFSIAIYSKVLDTKIIAMNPFRIIRRLFGDFDHNAQVKDLFNKDQVCLSSDPIHSSTLIVSKLGRDNLSAVQSCYRYFIKPLPRKNSLIVDQSTIEPKLWFNGLISLVGFADLADSKNGELCRESEFLPDRIIHRLLDFYLVGTMNSKDSFSYLITSFVKPLHCFR